MGGGVRSEVEYKCTCEFGKTVRKAINRLFNIALRFLSRPCSLSCSPYLPAFLFLFLVLSRVGLHPSLTTNEREEQHVER